MIPITYGLTLLPVDQNVFIATVGSLLGINVFLLYKHFSMQTNTISQNQFLAATQIIDAAIEEKIHIVILVPADLKYLLNQGFQTNQDYKWLRK